MSVFANSGQICIAGSRLFVERPIYEDFVERVAAYAAKLRIGDGADPATEIGPLISERQLQRVTGYLEPARPKARRLLTGGTRLIEGALAARAISSPPTRLLRRLPTT